MLSLVTVKGWEVYKKTSLEVPTGSLLPCGCDIIEIFVLVPFYSRKFYHEVKNIATSNSYFDHASQEFLNGTDCYTINSNTYLFWNNFNSCIVDGVAFWPTCRSTPPWVFKFLNRYTFLFVVSNHENIHAIVFKSGFFSITSLSFFPEIILFF